jgi:hypothetical protein
MPNAESAKAVEPLSILWSYHFVIGRTHHGRSIRMLTPIFVINAPQRET